MDVHSTEGPPNVTINRKDSFMMAHRNSPAEPFPGLFDSVNKATRDDLTGKVAESKKISENKQNVWLEFLGKLKLYKQVHGNCLVPRGYDVNPRLANWVCEQRKQFKLLKDGKKTNITQERIDMLDEIGFAWNAQQAAWDSHFYDLRNFRETHGHCLVPEQFKEFPKLYVWIKEQRRHYSLWKQGKPSHMTEQRYQALESIDFCWDHREAIWSTRLQQLKDYKDTAGHCLVPAEFPDNPKLGRWVKQQRKEYRKWLLDQPSQITKRRITALEAIGFCWRAGKKGFDPKAEKDCDADSDDDEPAITQSEDSISDISKIDGQPNIALKTMPHALLDPGHPSLFLQVEDIKFSQTLEQPQMDQNNSLMRMMEDEKRADMQQDINTAQLQASESLPFHLQPGPQIEEGFHQSIPMVQPNPQQLTQLLTQEEEEEFDHHCLPQVSMQQAQDFQKEDEEECDNVDFPQVKQQQEERDGPMPNVEPTNCHSSGQSNEKDEVDEEDVPTAKRRKVTSGNLIEL